MLVIIFRVVFYTLNKVQKLAESIGSLLGNEKINNISIQILALFIQKSGLFRQLTAIRGG